MGWKVLERELNRVGKSIEGEGKRLADRASDELARFAEKQLMIKNNKDKAAAAAAEAEAAASAVIDTPLIEEIKNPNGLGPGRAYIINTITFNDTSFKRRTGSEADVERLRKIFRKFGMKVKIAADATLADVRAMMKKISLFDFNSSSCLVIMSHGSKRNIIEAKDGQYCLDLDVLALIVKNKSLTSKLKFIAVEASKGPVNPLLQIEGQHLNLAEIPIEILQINSYVSYLDQRTGSLFITTLCEHLEKSGLNESILDIVSAVVLDVKQNYSSSCLVIVIMSHGSKRNIIEAKDGQYCLDLDVLAPIVKNKSLTTKLKFIAVEACKGPVNPLLQIEGQHLNLAEIPIEILQINSCVEGYVSYLDQRNGSLFITTLCEHLEKSGLNESILDIVSAVVLDVKQNYSDIQIPMVHTNFTKKFVFGHYAPSEHDIDVDAIDENLSDDENLSENNELISI